MALCGSACVVAQLGHEAGADCNPQSLCEDGLVCVGGTCQTASGGGTQEPAASFLRVLEEARGPALRVGQPRGLAHDGETLWTYDALTKQLVRLSAASGEALERWPLARHGLVGLAWVADGLYLGFDQVQMPSPLEALPAQVLVLDPQDADAGPVDSGLTLEALGGLCRSDGLLLTAEASNLRLRNAPTLAAARVVAAEASGAPLVRLGGLYLLYAGGEQDVQGRYTSIFEVLDATNEALAAHLGQARLPVDVSTITGLTSHEGDLWVIGAGYGEDAATVVRLTVGLASGGAP